MLYGIPGGLAAAVVPPLAPVVMAPCEAGTRWVSTIAYLAAGRGAVAVARPQWDG